MSVQTLAPACGGSLPDDRSKNYRSPDFCSKVKVGPRWGNISPGALGTKNHVEYLCIRLCLCRGAHRNGDVVMILWTRVAMIGFALAAGQMVMAQHGHILEMPPQKGMMPPTSGAPAEAPDELMVGGKVVGKRVEPEPGEFCVVCNERLHEGDVVYMVQGQRVAVHLGACQQHLSAQPRRWLSQLKPGGAFLSARGDQVALSPFWFFAGLYVLLGVVFAGACAHQAVQKALPPVRWFFVGLFLNAAGYLVLVTRPSGQMSQLPEGVPKGLRKVPHTHSFTECPKCGYHNHPSAQSCLGCGAAVTPSFESEAARWQKKHPIH